MNPHERFLNKEEIPSDSQIKKALGKEVIKEWNALRDYIKTAYNIEPVLIFGGKNYGWMFKYRKSSKTLCVIFPEKVSFTTVIVFGKLELQKVMAEYKSLSKKTQKIINDTHQYHDGKWVKFRTPDDVDIEQIKIMLAAKRKPKISSK